MMIAGFLITIFGFMIGSFLNVCIYRLPREESLISLPSHCINCGTRLKIMDLIPIVSYVMCKGRCKYCDEKISIQSIIVETVTGAMFLVLWLKLGLSIYLIFSLFLAANLVVAFFVDLEHQIIPNEVVIASLVGGVILYIYSFFGEISIYSDRTWWNPILGAFIGSGFLLFILLIGYIFYKSDQAMGMGDIKLFFPIGLYLGWRMTVVALLLSIILGGLSSLILLVTGIKNRKSTIPFGPFIVVGTLITVGWGWDILKAYIIMLS